jgi:trehalose-6-phosphate synthase
VIFTNPVIKDDTRRKVATAFRNVGKEGVLVLSSFAGVAAEMAEALLINPFDQERTAFTVKCALAR